MVNLDCGRWNGSPIRLILIKMVMLCSRRTLASRRATHTGGMWINPISSDENANMSRNCGLKINRGRGVALQDFGHWRLDKEAWARKETRHTATGRGWISSVYNILRQTANDMPKKRRKLNILFNHPTVFLFFLSPLCLGANRFKQLFKHSIIRFLSQTVLVGCD